MDYEKGLREAVEGRLRQLLEERDKIDVAMAELRRLLKAAVIPKTVIVAGHVQEPQPGYNRPNGKPVGLRATLCSTIAAHPGISRDEAIDSLEASGFKPGGATPLRILVTSELYRLANAGRIRKEGDGRYYLVEMEGEK